MAAKSLADNPSGNSEKGEKAGKKTIDNLKIGAWERNLRIRDERKLK